MAITHVADASNAVTASPIVVNKPAGVVSGDTMVAWIIVFGTTGATVTPPAGWSSLIAAVSDATGGFKGYAFSKVAGGSEGANYSFSMDVGTANGIISAWRGVDNTTPIDVSATQDNTVANASVTVPSITTTATNDVWLALVSDAGNGTWQTSSGWTLAIDDTGSDGVYYRSVAAAGATGSSTVTFSVSNQSITISVGLKADTGAVAATTTTITPHAQWPNPQSTRVRAAILRRPHNVRSGNNDNDAQHGVLEEFYGDGTQPLLANVHAQWPSAPLRMTSRVALTTKAPGYNARGVLGIAENDLTSALVDEFYGIIGKPGTVLSDTITFQANSAVLAPAQVVEADVTQANSALAEAVAQLVEQTSEQSNSLMVEAIAQVVEPSTEQSNAALTEAVAQIVEPSVLQSNSSDTEYVQIVATAIEQGNSALTDSVQLVAATSTLQANSALTEYVQLVAPAVLQANSLLVVTGGLAGVGGGTLISNSLLTEAAQVVAPASEQSNAALVEAAQILAPSTLQANTVLTQAAQVVEKTTELASSALTFPTAQVVAPVTVQANSLLVVTGGLAGGGVVNGTGTLVSNSAMIVVAAIVAPALVAANTLETEYAQAVAHGLLALAASLLVATGTIFNPNAIIAGDAVGADSAFHTATPGDLAVHTAVALDVAVATAVAVDSAP